MAKKTQHKNLTQYQIRANDRHISHMDELAGLRNTTRTQLIREAIFQFLIRELRSEASRQDGYNKAKANLDQLTRGW